EGGFTTRAGFQGQLVIHAEEGVDAPSVQQPVADLLEEIEASVSDVTVSSPYAEHGAAQVSADGTVAFADLSLADRSDAEYADDIEVIRGLVDGAAVPGADLELGGDRFVEQAEGGSEAIGFMAAIVILL